VCLNMERSRAVESDERNHIGALEGVIIRSMPKRPGSPWMHLNQALGSRLEP
jgi:hypothetical protein